MWRYLLGALVVFIISRAPVHCDVDTLQHCDNEDILKITYLKTKTKSELELLLELENSELEIVEGNFKENIQILKEKMKMIEDQLDLVFKRYSEQVKEHSADLIMKLLASKVRKN